MYRTRTVDLAYVPTPSSFIGRAAVWTDFNDRPHVGKLAADPFGGPFPVVDFGDGTHGRNGSVVELLEYEPPTLTEIDPEPQWSALWYSTPAPSSQAGLATFRGAR